MLKKKKKRLRSVAAVMVTELGALDSMFISATIYLGQGLVPSVLISVNCKGSSTILGMSEMDVYSPY